MRTIADAPGSALPPPPPPGTPTPARLSRSGLGRLRTAPHRTAHAASLGRPGPPVRIPQAAGRPARARQPQGSPSQPTLTSSPSPPLMPFTTTAAAASARPLRRSRRPPPPSPPPPPPRALPPAGAAGQGHRLRRPPPPPRLLRPLPGFGHWPDAAGRAGRREGGGELPAGPGCGPRLPSRASGKRRARALPPGSP